jgi:hypothetical protein
VAAGAFSLGIDADGQKMRMVEYWANLRSRYLGLPYGDQGMFLRAARFHQCGGFPELPIMEDFAMMQHLRKTGRIVTVRSGSIHPPPVAPMGVLRTTLINQAIIAAICWGSPPIDYRDGTGVPGASIDRPGPVAWAMDHENRTQASGVSLCREACFPTES